MEFKDTEYGDLTGKNYLKNIYLVDKELTSLNGSPKTLKGIFDCSNNKLTSLENTPIKVGDYYNCSKNLLTSLKYLPETINIRLICSYNKLTTLEGLSKEINGDFNCSNNQLTTLEGRENTIIKGTFDCTDCPKLINPKQQIIEHQIKAEKYQTDKGDFSFNDIKKEFEEYGRKLENSLKLKSSINNNEFGLSI